MKKVALIISCFDWYKNRLEPIREILEKEYNVTILLSDYDHIRKIAQTECYSVCTYLHVPPYHKNISIERIWSHFCFGQAVRRQIQLLQPDLIYLVLPPNYTAFHCLRYFRKHPYIRYYIDLIDLWPESFPNKNFQRTIFAKLWKKLRNDSIRAADHIFVECDLYRQKLIHVIGSRERVTALRLFREQSPEEYALIWKKMQNINKREKYVSLAYLGSINNVVDIDGILWIVDVLIKNRYNVEIRIIGNGENRDIFLSMLESKGAIVQYHGEIYEQLKKIEILSDCDYALNMMRYETVIGLTIKSVDYLSMGIPLLNNVLGDTWNLVEKYKIGINIDNNNNFMEKLSKNINRKKILEIFQKNFSKSAFKANLYPIIEI